jgi:hypothetical protein
MLRVQESTESDRASDGVQRFWPAIQRRQRWSGDIDNPAAWSFCESSES